MYYQNKGDLMFEYDPCLLPERVNEFASYLLGVKGCSKLTVNGYVRDLRLLFEYLSATKKSIFPLPILKKIMTFHLLTTAFLQKSLSEIYMRFLPTALRSEETI